MEIARAAWVLVNPPNFTVTAVLIYHTHVS